MENKIDLALKSCANKNYIYHVADASSIIYIYITEKHGKSFGRCYIYTDDLKTIYLDSLSVDPKFRKLGLGLELQLIRENIGIAVGCNNSSLWTEKDSWMYYWYLRRGYVELQEYKEEENAVWMEKKLIN